MKNSEKTTLSRLRAIVEHRQHAKVNGVSVDLFTASAVVQVHDALSPQNQARYSALPLTKMINIAWRLTATGGAR